MSLRFQGGAVVSVILVYPDFVYPDKSGSGTCGSRTLRVGTNKSFILYLLAIATSGPLSFYNFAQHLSDVQPCGAHLLRDKRSCRHSGRGVHLQ